jgi:homoserine kinase
MSSDPSSLGVVDRSEPPSVGAAVRVPGTTANIGPGFDAFGAAVTLHLDAQAVPLEHLSEDGSVVVRTEGEGSGELATDGANLLWRSMLALFAHAGVAPPAVGVAVRNRIPLERGLGSSSAAIVAGLGLGRRLLERRFSDLEIIRIATDIEGHPDNVAPAVLGGFVVAARAEGGRLVVRRSQPHARLRPVVMVPVTRQATTQARGVVPASLTREDVIDQAARAGHVVGALVGAWPAHPQLAGDRLHEPPRSEAMPASGALLAALRDAGIHAWLSGAGPTVCAAVPIRHDEVWRAATDRAAEHGFEVNPLTWDLGGLVTCPPVV